MSNWPRPERVVADQTKDISTQRVPYRDTLIRYTYFRSSDSRQSEQPGQDYLTFGFVGLPHWLDKFVFVVCDGVGGSFMGHLGAQELGSFLFKKLQTPFFRLSPRDSLKKHLTEALNEFSKSAGLSVADFSLPEDLSPLTRKALEKQREYGSEAMFACGTLTDRRLAIAWLGDVRLQILDCNRQPLDSFAYTPDVNSRWSSRQGVRGELQTVVIDDKSLRQAKHILAFSDGLASVQDEIVKMEDGQIDETVAMLGISPTSDDISLIHVIRQWSPNG